MKFCVSKWCFIAAIAGVLVGGDVFAAGKMLSPQNFNKMYWLATQGKVGILREAVNRGLNIDAVNPNGDTGLCIAIKRGDYIAYNSFRMSGANTRPPCSYKIYEKYQEFLASNKTVHADAVVGNEESLYYNVSDVSWTPWILGGAGVAGVAALLSGGGSGSKPADVQPVYMGLTSYLDNYAKLVSGGNVENTTVINGRNPDGENAVNQISFLPNMLNNATYLKTAVKVVNGASFVNKEGGKIELSDASVGLSAYGQNSVVNNDGSIVIEGQNGVIGMAASNNAEAYNGLNTGVSGETSDNGSIRMVFQGSKEGDTVIGMYGDTTSEIVNDGKIIGTGTSAVDYSTNKTESTGDSNIQIMATSSSTNSGTILGMGLFDFYAGTDLSNSTSQAQNNGQINLSAGYSNASAVSVSLIGMGSYIDDNFLEGKNNPAFAENMKLFNAGAIDLAYQGQYNLASEVLKNGNGGLVGMRADVMAKAVNQGDIKIDMQATEVSSGVDAAAGMLAVHGGEIVNGVEGAGYDGTTENLKGTIRVVNEATSGGVYYGMLAAKGSGKQTTLYNWKTPKLINYGVIDMQVSNSYGMASFTGGELVNEGVILLGVEKGQSYYSNNYGLYAAGGDKAEQGPLVNKGVIRVNSKDSTAIYNAYSGAVEMKNEGDIYISNKAVGSNVFGGNYSQAINSGRILYAAGNSENFTFPPQISLPGAYLALQDYTPKSSVISVSVDDNTANRLFKNEESGLIEIGKIDENSDYGGTYGTAGVKVSKQAGAVNYGDIHLIKFNDKQGQFNVGMWLDSTATAEAYLTNYGTIKIDSISSGGMLNEAVSNTNVVNHGRIEVSGRNSYGMAAGAPETNIYNGSQNSTSAGIYVGDSAYGMVVVGEKFERTDDMTEEDAQKELAKKKKSYGYNYGTIYLQGNGAAAFYLPYETGVIVARGNVVSVSNYANMSAYLLGKGNWTFDDAGTDVLKGYSLARVLNGGNAQLKADAVVTLNGKNSGLFIADGEGAKAVNLGKVEVLDGATALKSINGGSVENEGNIVIAEGTGLEVAEGTAVNTGVIDVIEGKGVFVDKGTMENVGTIQVLDGVGVEVKGNGNFINREDGEIAVANGQALRVEGQNASALNEGEIRLSQNGSVFVGDNGIFANSGTIVYDAIDAEASDISEKIKVSGNGEFINNGVVDFSDAAFDFGDGENFVLSGNGAYKASSLSGNVAVDNGMVMSGFEDVYVNKGAFEGDTTGLSVSSKSYMFDTFLTENDESTVDVKAQRKDFKDLVEEKDLAEFFEMNYKLKNNEKMFGALKSASNANAFNNVKDSESGKKFYANLQRENMAVLRGLNSSEQKRILADGIDGGNVGAGYFRTGKDGVDGLSGYADDVYSVYGSYGKRLGKGWSIGASVEAAHIASEYDDINSNRENKILMALIPVMYQNKGFKFLTMPEAGVGFGTYKRRAVSGVYEADSRDFYYGLYNHAEYSIDVKVAELVTEAELNLQGISAAKAKEKGGLNLGANDAVSLEAGIGLKLRKRFELAKKRSLELAIGAKYYHELLNPYKDLSISMNGSPAEYSLKGYDEDKDRIKTTAEAVYKDGNLSVAAEISHNAEKEASLEGGVGVWYNF